MSKKSIARFRREAFGLFLDLADGGRVGVNRRSGQILLDEGDGPDRYHGAVIQPDDFRYFSLEDAGAGRLRLELHFGEEDIHLLGDTTDSSAALQWIRWAMNDIHARRKPRSEHKHVDQPDVEQTEGRSASATKLYVGNLSFNATEGDLMDLFARAGKVEEVLIMQDRFTGKSRGFAFVTMETDAAAQAAISKFDGKNVEGRVLTVNEARPRQERSDDHDAAGSWSDHRRRNRLR